MRDVSSLDRWMADKWSVAWDVSGIYPTWTPTPAPANTFAVDISQWDVSNVASMDSTFHHASVFDVDLNAWDVSGVTTLRRTFRGALQFNGNIAAWDTARVATMERTFAAATIETESAYETRYQGALCYTGNNKQYATTFNRDVGAWDVSQVTHMGRMFEGNYAFDQHIGSWDTGKVATMSSMFQAAHNFTGAGISEWNTARVTAMRETFSCASAFNADISKWAVAKVIAMDFFLHADKCTWDEIGRKDCTRDATLTGFSRDLAGWKASSFANTTVSQPATETLQGTLEMLPTANPCPGRLTRACWYGTADLEDGYCAGCPLTDGSLRCALADGWFAAVNATIEHAQRVYGSITAWDVSDTVDMGSLFQGRSEFNDNVARWDVSNVAVFSTTFEGASMFNQGIGQWVRRRRWHSIAAERARARTQTWRDYRLSERTVAGVIVSRTAALLLFVTNACRGARHMSVIMMGECIMYPRVYASALMAARMCCRSRFFF